MATKTVPSSARALVVEAYAYAIMQDLLTDCALSGEPVPATLPDETFADVFEETFLQFNAEQFAIGGPNPAEGQKVYADAVALVNRWLAIRAS